MLYGVRHVGLPQADIATPLSTGLILPCSEELVVHWPPGTAQTGTGAGVAPSPLLTIVDSGSGTYSRFKVRRINLLSYVQF